MNDKFYCYSNRLSLFIRSFGVKYIEIGVNAKTKTRYHLFDKSKKLDSIIELYNEIKHRI